MNNDQPQLHGLQFPTGGTSAKIATYLSGLYNNLQSKLVKVKKGILQFTLKMILKTYYHLPARQTTVISPAVQPHDMMGRHRDGEHHPLERPEASEEEENVVVDGPSSTDQGEICFSNRGREGPRNTTSYRSPFRAAE